MTYKRLFELKYKKGLTTYELFRRFPESAVQVSEVALLEVPEDTLRSIVGEEKSFNRLMRLKKRFSRLL